MPTRKHGRSKSSLPGARRLQVPGRVTCSCTESRTATTDSLSHVRTAAAAVAELQEAEAEAQRNLAIHGVEWPAEDESFPTTQAMFAHDTLRNLHSARHAAASGEIGLALYYAFRAGRASRAMFMEHPGIRRVFDIGLKSISGALQSRQARRSEGADERRLIVKRYNDLRRMHEKTEVAKLQCAREFGISRSTVCRYLAKEKCRQIQSHER
jgi:hypothetical protein